MLDDCVALNLFCYLCLVVTILPCPWISATYKLQECRACVWPRVRMLSNEWRAGRGLIEIDVLFQNLSSIQTQGLAALRHIEETCMRNNSSLVCFLLSVMEQLHKHL